MTALQSRKTMFPEVDGPGANEPVQAENSFELFDVLRHRLRTPSHRDLKMTAAWLLPASILTGVLVSLGDGPIGAGLAGLVILIILAWRLPHFAAYVMIAGAPIVVGFGRDQVLPMLRVNEALLAVLLLVLAVKWLVTSRRVVIRLHSLDYVILAMVFSGFVLTMITQLWRTLPLGMDDILYAAVFLRMGLLYALVRITIRTQGQVRTALTLSLVTASALAVLGTMDSLNLISTAERLHRFFPNDNVLVDDGRGAATIGNPIGFGVYQGIHAMIGLSMYLGGERPRRLVGFAAGLCCIGVVGSGQIGPLLSFAVGLVALAWVTRSFGRLARFGLPLLLVTAIVAAPLLARRVAGFDGAAVSSEKREDIANSPASEQGRQLFEANPGSSWDVRLYNLEMFFIPSLKDTTNLVWGVTPQARVTSPREGEEFIWIESGHLWLLWSGGVWLFMTWFALMIVGMVQARKALRRQTGPIAVAGAAAFGSLWIMNVAQTFDPHMTLRGSADAFYPLLALMMAATYQQTRMRRPSRAITQEQIG